MKALYVACAGFYSMMYLHIAKGQDVELKQEFVDTISGAATKITHASGAVTVLFGFTVEQWGIIAILIGILTTISTATFTIWFKLKYQRGDQNE